MKIVLPFQTIYDSCKNTKYVENVEKVQKGERDQNLDYFEARGEGVVLDFQIFQKYMVLILIIYGWHIGTYMTDIWLILILIYDKYSQSDS